MNQKYEKMAENKVRRNQGSPVEFDSDTPVPAAEVLIDLKESARRRRTLQKLRSSPRRKKQFSESPRKTPNHRSSSRRLDFSHDSSNMQNSVSETSEDDEEDMFKPQPQKRQRRETPLTHNQQAMFTSPSKPRADQAILHSVSSRLRNLLKLPKAHKWCYYEWFYSDVDQPLFEGENDFCRCLSEMFPELKTRQLTRVQWHQLRRLMGKPRRCSPTFFKEERALMEYKRNKARQIQEQVHQGVITVADFSTYKDIPDELPALLVVGTSVTARLHTERERGFFTGRIEAVDIENHSYWVTFDRPGLGKHAIPDTEIKSAEPPEMISISALEASQKTHWPPRDQTLRPRTPPRPIVPDTPAMHALLSPDSHSDPFLTSSPARRKMLNEPPTMPGVLNAQMPDHVGGFPVDFLKQVALSLHNDDNISSLSWEESLGMRLSFGIKTARVTQLSKLLALKQQRVQRLTDMNTEVEKMHARQKSLPVDFQRQYATVIIELDDINKQLNMRLEAIKSHCVALGYSAEIGPVSMDVQEHAQKITESANTSLEASGSEVKDPELLELISRLTSLLLQIEALSESGNSMEMNTLTKSIEEIEAKIHPQNRNCFRDNVETPLTLIQSGMNPIGTLHAFSVSTLPRTATSNHPNS